MSIASASAMNEHSASRGRLAFIHGFTTGNWYYLYSNWDSLVLQRISLLLPQCHVDLIDLISTVANYQDTLPNALDLLSPRHTLHRSCLCFKLRLFVNAHRGEEVKSLPFSAGIHSTSPADLYEPLYTTPQHIVTFLLVYKMLLYGAAQYKSWGCFERSLPYE